MYILSKAAGSGIYIQPYDSFGRTVSCFHSLQPISGVVTPAIAIIASRMKMLTQLDGLDPGYCFDEVEEQTSQRLRKSPKKNKKKKKRNS